MGREGHVCGVPNPVLKPSADDVSTSLRARKMKVDAVEAKAELMLRSLDAFHRKILALQAVTAALAARVDLGEGDSRALAAELAAQHPPELADPLREEIARLIRR